MPDTRVGCLERVVQFAIEIDLNFVPNLSLQAILPNVILEFFTTGLLRIIDIYEQLTLLRGQKLTIVIEIYIHTCCVFFESFIPCHLPTKDQ